MTPTPKPVDLLALWQCVGLLAPEEGTGGITQHPDAATANPPTLYWRECDYDCEDASIALCDVWNRIPALLSDVERLRADLAHARHLLSLAAGHLPHAASAYDAYSDAEKAHNLADLINALETP